MALYTPNQAYNAITNVFESPLKVLNSYAGTNQMTMEESYYAYKNLSYAYTEAPTFYREIALEAYEGTTTTATEHLVSQAVVNSQTGVVEGSTAAKMPAVTTGAGNVKAGALAGRASIGTLAGAVAIGAGIGLKEVAQHRKFWDDLSGAIYNDIKGDPGALVGNYLQWPETETAEVLWRALEDGGIQSYCDKRTVDKIVENLYAYNALNTGSVSPVIDQPGYQPVTYGNIDVSVVMGAAREYGAATSAAAITAAYNGAIAHAGSNPINAMSANVSEGRVSVSVYYMPDHLDIVQSGSILQVNTPVPGGITACVVRYDTQTGEITNIDYESASAIVPIGSMKQGSIGFCSNVGSIVTPWNDAVIPQPEAVQAPSDPSQFWTTFADWLANGFTSTSYNPVTNANETTTYVPFTFPEINWQNESSVGDQSKVWTGVYEFVDPFTTPTGTPINNPSPWIYESIGNFEIPKIKVPDNTTWNNNPKFPTPTPTPIGSTPTIVAPSSSVDSGNKLYTVYNPTQAQVDALGAYLWTENIIQLISQFFKNNPLDAIISLHQIYCTPSTGSAKNIILGYLNSGVSANIVTSQYVDIACGDVNIPELYGNALDYTGVSIQVFLPFVGYRTLKTKDLIGKRVEIDYKVDVYTGVCLALIYVISTGSRQLLYSFEGNCSVQVPLTAADRTRLIAGLTTAGVSAFTGNPAGVVGGIASIGTNIDRSGGFSGNAGAMGVKKPYIIITRAIDAQASHFNKMYGYPTNRYGVLMNFKGFTRVKSVHVDIPDATADEMAEVQSMLNQGIVI